MHQILVQELCSSVNKCSLRWFHLGQVFWRFQNRKVSKSKIMNPLRDSKVWCLDDKHLCHECKQWHAEVDMRIAWWKLQAWPAIVSGNVEVTDRRCLECSPLLSKGTYHSAAFPGCRMHVSFLLRFYGIIPRKFEAHDFYTFYPDTLS